MKVVQYIETRGVEGSLREKLEQLEKNQSFFIESLLEKLNPNPNILREILSLVFEISQRDSISFEDLLLNSELQALLDSKESGKSKSAKFRTKLEKLRYPEKAKIESDLLDLQKNITQKYGLKVELPMELEGESLEVKFSFKNVKQLENIATKLSEMSKDSFLEEIFFILSGQC